MNSPHSNHSNHSNANSHGDTNEQSEPVGRPATNPFGLLIKKCGFTRETLAKRLKAASGTIGFWSSNGVPESRIAQVAKVLGVNESEIPRQDRKWMDARNSQRTASKRTSKPVKAKQPNTYGRGRPSTTGAMFGDMLREHGHTASTFAKRMKVKTNTAYSWASQGVPLKRVNKAAKVLGIDPSTIPVYVDPRSPRANQPVKKPVNQQPTSKPVGENQPHALFPSSGIGAINARLRECEEKYSADRMVLDTARARLDAAYATERGAIIATLAKEVSQMRALIAEYEITALSVMSVGEQNEPAQFGQPVSPQDTGTMLIQRDEQPSGTQDTAIAQDPVEKPLHRDGESTVKMTLLSSEESVDNSNDMVSGIF